MNERIQELIEQATTRKWRGDGTDSIPKEVFDKEKFAELIVKECVGVCMNVNGDLPRTEPLVAASIKKHFGVE